MSRRWAVALCVLGVASGPVLAQEPCGSDEQLHALGFLLAVAPLQGSIASCRERFTDLADDAAATSAALEAATGAEQRAAETAALPIFEHWAPGAADAKLADYVGHARTAEIFEPRSATAAQCVDELAETRMAIANIPATSDVTFDQLRKRIPLCQ